MSEKEPGVFEYKNRPEVTGENRYRTAADFQHDDGFKPIIDHSAALSGERQELTITARDGSVIWQGAGFKTAEDALAKGRIQWRDAALDGLRIKGITAHGRNMTGASLRGAVIEDADLSEINLTAADLTNAVFRNCILTRANLQGALTEGATFQGCTLHGVEVSGSDLKRDQLQGCRGLILKD